LLKEIALNMLLLRPSTARVEGAFSLMAAVITPRRGRLTDGTASIATFLAANRHLPDRFFDACVEREQIE
jgi:hypothetical protein